MHYFEPGGLVRRMSGFGRMERRIVEGIHGELHYKKHWMAVRREGWMTGWTDGWVEGRMGERMLHWIEPCLAAQEL